MSNRLLVLNNCKSCPHRESALTKGFGYAEDWLCRLTPAPDPTVRNGRIGRHIAGYLEWPSDEPTKIPDWCPLPKTKRQPVTKP